MTPSRPLTLADRLRRFRRSSIIAPLAALAIGACTFDPDEPCDANQRLSNGDICVCEAGFGMTAEGCVACGDNEVAEANRCVCEEGFARSNDAGPCEAVPAAQGAACDEMTPCTDTVFDHCYVPPGKAGYCTQLGCTSSSDCSGTYACDASAGVCIRPPLGLGKACASAPDCAGGEATFCDSFATHACLVQGCSLTADDCFVGYTCADLSSYGLAITLCVPEGSL